MKKSFLFLSLFMASFFNASAYESPEIFIDEINYIYNQDIQEEVFPENIEYCQFVYFTDQNPLKQKCDFEQVKRSLKINF